MQTLLSLSLWRRPRLCAFRRSYYHVLHALPMKRLRRIQNCTFLCSFSCPLLWATVLVAAPARSYALCLSSMTTLQIERPVASTRAMGEDSLVELTLAPLSLGAAKSELSNTRAGAVLVSGLQDAPYNTSVSILLPSASIVFLFPFSPPSCTLFRW